MSRLVGVVGSRSLPACAEHGRGIPYSLLVHTVVSLLSAQGYGIASGGALGADAFALSSLLGQGIASRSVLFSAWPSVSGFPVAVRPQVSRFLASGGQVVWGSFSQQACPPELQRRRVVSALLGRNRRLVSSSSALVAFLHGESRGSLFTVRQAVARGLPRATSGSEESRGIPVFVFLCGGACPELSRGGAVLPADLSAHCHVMDFN